MIKLYSQHLEQVKVLAKREAVKMGHWFVTPEHLLLGILSLKECQATHFLNDKRRGITYNKIYQKLKYLLGHGSNKNKNADPPRSLNNLMIFNNAEALASNSEALSKNRNKTVNTLHLLWAILQSEPYAIVKVLGLGDDELKQWCDELEETLTEPVLHRPGILSFRIKGDGRQNEELRTRLSQCNAELSKNLVVQEGAITRIADTLARSWAGFLGESRPMASFLFVGPMGSGKFTLALNIAKFLFNDTDRYFKLNLNDYSDTDGFDRLVRILEIFCREFTFGLLYLEGLEQAHPKVLELVHQILKDGKFKDEAEANLNFRNHVVILAVNVDADSFGSKDEKNLGFRQSKDKHKDHQEHYENLLLPVLDEALRPDTVSLVDEIVFLPPIGKEAQIKLLGNWVAKLDSKTKSEHNASLEIDDAVKDYLIKQNEDSSYGVTSLSSLFSREIGGCVAKALLERQSNRGVKVHVYLGESGKPVAEIVPNVSLNKKSK